MYSVPSWPGRVADPLPGVGDDRLASGQTSRLVSEVGAVKPLFGMGLDVPFNLERFLDGGDEVVVGAGEAVGAPDDLAAAVDHVLRWNTTDVVEQGRDVLGVAGWVDGELDGVEVLVCGQPGFEGFGRVPDVDAKDYDIAFEEASGDVVGRRQ